MKPYINILGDNFLNTVIIFSFDVNDETITTIEIFYYLAQKLNRQIVFT